MNYLIWLAVLPGAYFIYKVYSMDKIEKEPLSLLIKLLIGGAISVLPALLFEIILEDVLQQFYDPSTLIYILLENVIGVALVEEFFKLLFLKKISWKDREFNYVFDGIVYAVTVSMGFAIVENLMYVMDDGLETAILRMFTAVPLHAICGVFMGHYYGLQKCFYIHGMNALKKKNRFLSLFIPVVIHGFYDFVATCDNTLMTLVFLGFVFIMNFIAWRKLKKYSNQDTLIF